jgi:undecaprenyl-diphosphatase
MGVSRRLATEFSFFMSIPIMFGWSLVKLIKYGFHYSALEFFELLFGMVVAFVVSVVVIKFLMGYIKKNNFKIFGYYRIALGLIVIIIFAIKGLMS